VDSKEAEKLINKGYRFIGTLPNGIVEKPVITGK
jgi:hypothetical protein